jgi:hypothetical protein
VDGPADDTVKNEGRTDAVDHHRHFSAIAAKASLRLGASTYWTNGREKQRQIPAANVTDIIAFFPAADTPSGKKQVKC